MNEDHLIIEYFRNYQKEVRNNKINQKRRVENNQNMIIVDILLHYVITQMKYLMLSMWLLIFEYIVLFLNSFIRFSPCGNYLASSSEDRTLLLYPMKTLLDSSHPHKRVNVQGDVPGRFCFSINGTYILLSAQMMNQLYVYGVSSVCYKFIWYLNITLFNSFPTLERC